MTWVCPHPMAVSLGALVSPWVQFITQFFFVLFDSSAKHQNSLQDCLQPRLLVLSLDFLTKFLLVVLLV